jgi:hypothetical protein
MRCPQRDITESAVLETTNDKPLSITEQQVFEIL